MDLPAVGDGLRHCRVDLLHHLGCLLLTRHRRCLHFSGPILDIRRIIASILCHLQHVLHRGIQHPGILLHPSDSLRDRLHATSHHSQLLGGVLRGGIYLFHIGDNTGLFFLHMSAALGNRPYDGLHLRYQIIDGHG